MTNLWKERKGNRQQTFPQIILMVSLKLKMMHCVTKPQEQSPKQEFPICAVGDRASTGGGFVFVLGISHLSGLGVWDG